MLDWQALYMNSPGILFSVDLDHKLTAMNNNYIALLGFKSFDDAYGKDNTEAPCLSAKYSHLFFEQDRLTFKDKIIKSIDINYYADDQAHFFLTTKTPKKDKNNKVVGLNAQAIELKHSELLTQLQELSYNDNYFNGREQPYRSCYLDKNYMDLLTERQSECLFYLIRGKATKSIARILNISSKTVEYHFDCIRKKFQCLNKNELIEKVISLGGLNFIPESLLSTPRSVILSS